MKKIAAVILLLSAIAFACPMMVNCPVDGLAMSQQNCQNNLQTGKQVCEYSHQHFENGQMVTHYQYVSCN